MFPIVEIRQPDQPKLFVSLRGPIEVGRECDGLLLADPQVSRRHLSLDVVDAAVVVNDLGSTNGSAIDDVRITEPTVLAVGQVVTLGETSIRLDEVTFVSGLESAAPVGDDVATTTTMDAVADPVVPQVAAPAPPTDTADGSPWAPSEASEPDAVDPLLASPPAAE